MNTLLKSDIMIKTEIGTIRDGIRKYIYFDSYFRNLINLQASNLGTILKTEFVDDEYAILFYVDINKTTEMPPIFAYQLLRMLYDTIGLKMYNHYDRTILDANKNKYLDICSRLYKLYKNNPDFIPMISNVLIMPKGVIKIII